MAQTYAGGKFEQSFAAYQQVLILFACCIQGRILGENLLYAIIEVFIIEGNALLMDIFFRGLSKRLGPL